MNRIAQRYVELVLQLGVHDVDYVDAYYGPAEWRTKEGEPPRPLADIDKAAGQLIEELGTEPEHAHTVL